MEVPMTSPALRASAAASPWRLVLVGCVAVAASDSLEPAKLESDGSRVARLTGEHLSGPQQPDLLLLQYITPWCTHCQRFAYPYKSLAHKLFVDFPAMKVATIDCDAEQTACEEHGVESYPTFMLLFHDAPY